jgi:hypothetical protein
VYVSLDGQAAITGVGKGTFNDSTVPDLWFTLLGASSPTLVEAKIIDTNGRVRLMRVQLRAWRGSGTGAHKPAFWVATNRAFDSFFCWPHSAFTPILDATTATGKTVMLLPPGSRNAFSSVGLLALHILREVG